ncbi:sulfatase-like hydrolase/transferase [Caldilinea sp.]|uniref:sulfatase-like hydrolase/transferase n=1 Tax=Caldilinea sp. TaxID=2293560 RepID=UPI002C97B54E|nr:hypothetical protein [Caldilinea sp.]
MKQRGEHDTAWREQGFQNRRSPGYNAEILYKGDHFRMFDRLSLRQFSQSHPNLIFWGAFAVLNFLLFLPMFLLDPQSSVLPPASTLDGGWWPAVNHLLIWRENLDPWRISVELTVMIAAWVLMRWLRRPWIGALVGVFYALLLSYAIYEAVVASVFLLDPSFYGQFYLARDGLPFLAEHVNAAWWLYAGAIFVLLTGAAAVVWLLVVLLRSGASSRLHWASRLALGGLAALCLAAAVAYQLYTARPEMVFSSFGFKLQKNLALSLKTYQDVAAFDDSQVRAAYNYTGYRLERKPDIYVIFVESYGSVLYKRSHFRPTYLSLLSQLEDQLDNAGYHAATALSESPTWGGGSWLAYTSTLFGLRIDNHPQYLALRNKYQIDGSYPSLGKTLQDQGYHFAWLSALDENLSEVAWAKYTRLLSADELLRNKDLAYDGPRYGWGPAPPDQWVLHWAQERLKTENHQSLLLFTITQNSHYPWTPHPTLVDDWRTLDQPGAEEPPVDPDTISQEAMRRNYLNAITYQLRMLTQFIRDVGDEHSIFILIGDHQPPAVSRRADGWATPVHIISQDAALVAAFEEYGFTPGLTVSDLEPTLRHEGFYSLFIRVLFNNFGLDQIAAPVYLPQGIVPDQAAVAN